MARTRVPGFDGQGLMVRVPGFDGSDQWSLPARGRNPKTLNPVYGPLSRNVKRIPLIGARCFRF